MGLESLKVRFIFCHPLAVYWIRGLKVLKNTQSGAYHIDFHVIRGGAGGLFYLGHFMEGSLGARE